MKELYTKPASMIDEFKTVDVMTESQDPTKIEETPGGRD